MKFRPSAESKQDLHNNNLTSISSIQKGLNAFRPLQLPEDDIFLFPGQSYMKILL